MPIHDWTRVDAGIFHDFHQTWVVELKKALNAGLLPPDCYALVEQVTGEGNPDLLTLQRRYNPTAGDGPTPPAADRPGLPTLAAAPPRVRFRDQAPAAAYTRRAKTVVVRHTSDHRVVAMVEVVSPGNKAGRAAFRALVAKAVGVIQAGVNLLLLDLFPPGPRDPDGVHAAVWGELTDRPFALPADKPLTLVAYAADPPEAFAEPVAVGDPLPDMPLVLGAGAYVPVPLERTYRAAWESVPAYWQQALAG